MAGELGASRAIPISSGKHPATGTQQDCSQAAADMVIWIFSVSLQPMLGLLGQTGAPSQGLAVLAWVTPSPCSALSRSPRTAPARRRISRAMETLRPQDGSFQPWQVPSPGSDPMSPGTLTLSPAALSDTAEGTLWLVTGDPQRPAALSRAMQKQSEKN